MEEFRKCPTCGYGRGFHTSFSKDGDKIRVIFICPECGSSYDIELFQTGISDLNPVKGKTY